MADRAILHNQLVEERQRLVDGLAQIRKTRQEKDQREGSPFGKREEDATGVFELEKNLALEKQLSANLAMVDHALEKYKAGTYGVCDKCSNQIEPARLEALPYANLCLSCKAKQKKDAKA